MAGEHWLLVFLLGSTACSWNSEHSQTVMDRAEVEQGDTVEDRLGHALVVQPDEDTERHAESATAITLQVLAVHTDGEDLVPDQPLLEVIQTDERFSEVVAMLGSKAGFGLPHSDGSRWYPRLDAENDVVLWIYSGLDNIGATFADFSAIETAETVMVSYTVGVRSCLVLGAIGYPYAFVRLPKTSKPYQLSPSSPALNCAE
jgi:hypothetical protein